jgi:hypothetical protein
MKIFIDVISIIGIFIMFFLIATIDYRIAMEKIPMSEIILKYWWSFPVFIFGAPIIWYGYRALFLLTGNIWITHIINAGMSYMAFLIGIYFVSGTFPTKYQGIALILNLIAIIVSLS